MRFNNGFPNFNFVQPGRQYSQAITESQGPSLMPHTPITPSQHQQQPLPPPPLMNMQPPAWAIELRNYVSSLAQEVRNIIERLNNMDFNS